ncbi:asparagine synthase-related protein [Croceicoccus hydrothermalis]|uniref:asparagine synthase-related protein n=1 Tax=Croceicoccus hydrothermalis TaxID=2867964 RepID=UPI001EFBFA53
MALSLSGRPVLLDGWIDNADSLKAELDFSGGDDAALYGAALDAWGDDAERRIVGSYVGIVVERDRSLRLSRSPWSQQALFWAADRDAAAAASIPRPIFAAGFPKSLLPDRMAEMLHGSDHDIGRTEYFYRGLHRVPLGSIVTVSPDGAAIDRWYDPHDIPAIRLKNDGNYVDAVAEKLGEACAAALRPAKKPGIMLSGGLDSATVADVLMAQMPERARLASFTFTTLPEWDGHVPAGSFADERPLVEAYAAMHPRLDPHFTDNRDIGFDSRLDRLFIAADTAHRHMNLTAAYHGPMQAATDHGCDWLFSADFGNQTFSIDGRWAFSEFLRTGEWGELWQMLRDHPGDSRPMARRVLARSVLPQLPARLRKTLRRLVHSAPHADHLIRPELAGALRLRERRERSRGRLDDEWFRSRREFIDHCWQMADLGTEMGAAHEQVFGIRLRSIPRYRPLIELCHGLPTTQYVRGGTQRYLGRRLAKGRMPARQAEMRDYGLHHADWHARMTPRLSELRAEIDRIGDHPDLARIIDVDRARALLADWPESEPVTGTARSDLFNAISAAVVAARFANYVDGRNDV